MKWSGFLMDSVSGRTRFAYNEREFKRQQEDAEKLQMSLNRMVPAAETKDLGACVTVGNSLTKAFRQVDRICMRNNVPRQFKNQRYYEKPSEKRSRLRSEAHRAKFRAGIIRLVNLAKNMRRWGY
ncbi:ribosomal protein subunit Mrp21 [Schizosaccharomyces octosporus yFS286]|uniref:Ribosomal protein subunit Mrp21 n=1 Tax=Schizosaccharomyces octosporus (strain yFS286) TaxID=483514 RepID=S9RAQ3_SCHOY|nr:ribosomal protein subunit Mrp21 [Schizosaccharomyces octosporus yFS286]EPX75215.1 ribosomal protein subunit Mrp21 [Schizosaccharomyces octosporus yFS286]